jgi:DeoR/GlpR family transcriptional regulator of sugar metabolism
VFATVRGADSGKWAHSGEPGAGSLRFESDPSIFLDYFPLSFHFISIEVNAMSSYNPRWDEIRQVLQAEQRVSVATLAGRFKVSEVTIRKDLALMEGRGLLLRTHGGAVLAEDSRTVIGFNEKSRQSLREKELIARKAAELVRPGQNIILDSGTTCLALAQVLKGMEIQVITNSLTAASALAGGEGLSMVILGGAYRAVTAAIIGQSAVEQLRQYNADIAFIGASGATPEGGFSCQNLHEAQIKKVMLQQASTKVMLMDSSKFGTNKFAAFAAYGDMDLLVTDDGISAEHRQALLQASVKVL